MKRKKMFSMVLFIIVSVLLLNFGGICCFAQEETEEAAVQVNEDNAARVTEESQNRMVTDGTEVLDDQQSGMTLLELVRKGGYVGYLIIVLSFIALGLVIDYALTIRRSNLAPPQEISALKEFIRGNKLEEIKKMGKEKTSYLSQVVVAGIHEADLGYQTMIKAMEDAGEALSAGIARKIEHLNIIANISPMMGLLGTVIGMLRCFNEISQVTGAIDPKQLAGGIFEALVTTCMGLIVAIPSLYFYAIFRNRADEITGETSLIAEEMLTSFKADQTGQ